MTINYSNPFNNSILLLDLTYHYYLRFSRLADTYIQSFSLMHVINDQVGVKGVSPKHASMSTSELQGPEPFGLDSNTLIPLLDPSAPFSLACFFFNLCITIE